MPQDLSKHVLQQIAKLSAEGNFQNMSVESITIEKRDDFTYTRWGGVVVGEQTLKGKTDICSVWSGPTT